MWTIKQPSKIIFGENSVREFTFPEKCLIITSKGAKSRGWLDYSGLNNQLIFEGVKEIYRTHERKKKCLNLILETMGLSI